MEFNKTDVQKNIRRNKAIYFTGPAVASYSADSGDSLNLTPLIDRMNQLEKDIQFMSNQITAMNARLTDQIRQINYRIDRYHGSIITNPDEGETPSKGEEVNPQPIEGNVNTENEINKQN